MGKWPRSPLTNITGVSGRAISQALLNGLQDAQALAELARGRLCEPARRTGASNARD